ILQIIGYMPQWSRSSSEPNQVSSFAFTGVFLTVPLSYVFGLIPSALAGVGYCGVLSYFPRMRNQRWLRTIPAAGIGGLVGAVFGLLFSDSLRGYALLCSGFAAFLPIFTPPPTSGATDA